MLDTETCVFGSRLLTSDGTEDGLCLMLQNLNNVSGWDANNQW